MGEASSTQLCTAAEYAALLRPTSYELPDRYRSDSAWFLNHGWPLNENIQNDPMQSSMVRSFERSRKNILTHRANHRHIFIVARIEPAPENPLRAF
jgi:hypothetical protein